MKNPIIYSFTGLILLLSFYYNSQVVKGEEQKVIAIVNNLNKMNAEINEWTIFIKDDVKYIKSINEFRKIEAKVKKDYPEFNWEEEKDEDHHIKITGKRTNNQDEGEIITLLFYKDGDSYKMLKTYSFKGKEWSENRYTQIVNNVDLQKQFYFTIKARKNKLSQSGISQEAQKIIVDLSASQVEGLIEKDFVSISAYKEDWEGYISSNEGKKINLQIGIRKVADSPSVDLTIGSPIITEEY